MRHQSEILIRTTRQWKRLFFFVLCFCCFLSSVTLPVSLPRPRNEADKPLQQWVKAVKRTNVWHPPRRVCFHRWLWSAAVGQRRLQQRDGSVLTQKTGAFSTWNMTLPHLKWEAPPRSSTLCASDGAELLRENRSLIETPESRQPNFPGRDFSFLRRLTAHSLICHVSPPSPLPSLFSWSMASPAEAPERGPWLRGLLFIEEAVSWQWDGSPCRTSVYLKPELFFTQHPQISASEFTSDHESRCVFCAGLELYY